jgi:hypothetical protein
MSKKRLRVPVNLAAETAECLRNAQQFLSASARCMTADEVEGKFTGPFEVPALVNAVFAVELAFKVLLLKQLKQGDAAPDGHELHALFAKLTPTEQATLRAGVPLPVYPRPDRPSADPFMDAMHGHSRAFVKWRYVHESTHLKLAANLTFVSALARAAINLAS